LLGYGTIKTLAKHGQNMAKPSKRFTKNGDLRMKMWADQLKIVEG